MRIDSIGVAAVAGKPRLSARVAWEENDRPASDVYFQTESAFGDGLACRADPFLAAALTPALWAGERRILVEGDVCPELLDNLETVAALFQLWFKVGNKPIQIEAASRSQVVQRQPPPRSAIFFSGGLDSLAACRANRLRFPREHPGSIADGIIVFGLEVEQEQAFDYVVESLAELAQAVDVVLIPVSSNLRSLNPDWGFWYKAHMGPALCAVAHALGRRFSNVTVGSDYDCAHLVPHGSHPMVETNFSSHTLKVHYHGLTMSRLAKARSLAQWPAVLRQLRVCNRSEFYRPPHLNCGECEKCVRTMLELIAVDAFDAADVFRQRVVTSDMIARLYMPPAVEPYYEELIAPLDRVGRSDLSSGIVRALARVRGEQGVTGYLRKIDRHHLNGSIASLKRALLPPSPAKGW